MRKTVDELVRIALGAEDRYAVLRVPVECGVDLVVEVVERAVPAPQLLVLVEEPRVEAR